MKKFVKCYLLFVLPLISFAQPNIYNSDGTITANRIVTMDSKNLTFIPSTANCQFFINGTNGNIGIGTSTPGNRLHVVGAANSSGIRLGSMTSSAATTASNGKQLSVNSNGDIILSPSNVEPSLFAISTATSATSQADYIKKTHVFGAGYSTFYSTWNINRQGFNVFDLYNYGTHNWDEIQFNAIDRLGTQRFYFSGRRAGGSTLASTMLVTSDSNGSEFFKTFDDGANNVFIQIPKANSRVVIANWGNYKPEHKFVVSAGSALVEGNLFTDSNIGVGTSSFIDGADSYRVSINGALRAHRVKVYTTWADFVFEKNYHLPSLQDVENHIKEKGHLKDIPSAAHVESNGIELGEMNKLLLQKVEELTLYIIQINKEVQNLKSQLNKS